jgi:hypothetical protein
MTGQPAVQARFHVGATTLLLAVLLAAGCGGGSNRRRASLAGRWALAGPFLNSLEVSGATLGCGPPEVHGGSLDYSVTISPSADEMVTIHLDGPGCTVQARATDEGYAAHDAECVIEPGGPFNILGIAHDIYRSLVIDATKLTWTYDLEMTWPNSRYPDGIAKVCGHGDATLTRLADSSDAARP